MADERSDEPSRDDETAKLELPSFSLRKLRRTKRAPSDAEPGREPAGGGPGRPTAPSAPSAPSEPSLPSVAPEPTAGAPADDPPEPSPTPVIADTLVEDDQDDEDHAEPRAPRFPALPGWGVALVTGLVVGGAGALLTYLSLRGCDAVRGTKSCGGGPGLLLLVVILVLMVLLGAVLLTALRLPDARATSFLGIGVLCVVVLLTLMDQVFSPWMFLVVPVVCGAAYALAHAVATAFIEPTPEPGPQHDVR